MTSRHGAWVAAPLLLAAFAWPGDTRAQDSADSRSALEAPALRLSGFGTFGAIHVDAPEGWRYARESSHPNGTRAWRGDVDTRLGLQANYQASSNVELVGQFIARRRDPDAPLADGVEWAYAAYRPTPDWTTRVGRVNVDAFLMADYRNVGFGYPFVRPPVEFYGALPTSLDGLDISRQWTSSHASWRAKLFAGRSPLDAAAENSANGHMNLFGATLIRESDAWLLRASIASADLTYQIGQLQPLVGGLQAIAGLGMPPISSEAKTLADALGTVHQRAIFADVGARYESGDWVWSGELTHVSGSSFVETWAGYLSAGRRFDEVTLYAVASAARSPRAAIASPDWHTPLAPVIGQGGALQAQALADAAAGAINTARVHQSTVSIGARWDLRSSVAVKAQWDHVQVGANGTRMWGRATPQAGRANIVTVTCSFIF